MDISRGAEHDQLVLEERRRVVLELLRERRSTTAGALEQQVGVSPMTARRDLAILVREGHARRRYRGALLPDLAAHEDSLRHRFGLDTGIRFVAASRRPGKSTRKILNVDGGVALAYQR
jgi:hypothetical protein